MQRVPALKGFAIAAILLIIGVLLPERGQAQAAVGYGMAASHSTGMASRISSSISSRTQSIYRGTQQKLKIPPVATKNLQTVMQENREKLEKQSENGGGVVRVESVPPNATILVDGEPVGKAPTDLKLPEGKHTIELTHPRYDPWNLEVTVNAHESTSVTAKLENKYKSSITISFQ